MEEAKIYQVLRADREFGINHIGFFTSYEDAYTVIIKDIEFYSGTELAVSNLSKIIAEITTTTNTILVQDNKDTEYFFTNNGVSCGDCWNTEYQILKFSLNKEE